MAYASRRPESRAASRQASATSIRSQYLLHTPPPSVTHENLRAEPMVPSRGRSSSPLKQGQHNSFSVSSRTSVLPRPPVDLLHAPNVTNRHVQLNLRLSSPIFVGGATVEGELQMVIDGGKQSSFRLRRASKSVIASVSVVILGVESCKGRSVIFQALGSDLVPPLNQASTIGGDLYSPINQAPTDDGGWSVEASSFALPFCVDLPLMMGPPPYESKKASIRYVLSATVEVKIGKKQRPIRRSQIIPVLSVHDRMSQSWGLKICAEADSKASRESTCEPARAVAGI